MSKTAQRKRSLYDLGFEHGRKGHYFMWKRHPHIAPYRRGYKDGIKWARREKSMSFWQQIVAIFRAWRSA